MHQSTTPSVSQTIWPRRASRHFLTLPRVQTLLPVTFAYSLSSRKNLEAVLMRQLRRWKRLWRKSLTCSHKRTSMGLSRSCWNGTSALQPEEITSMGTRVSYKKSLETYCVLLVYYNYFLIQFCFSHILLFHQMCTLHQSFLLLRKKIFKLVWNSTLLSNSFCYW